MASAAVDDLIPLDPLEEKWKSFSLSEVWESVTKPSGSGVLTFRPPMQKSYVSLLAGSVTPGIWMRFLSTFEANNTTFGEQ